MAELKIKADSGGGTVSLKGPATTTGNAAVQLTLPVNDGDASQYLKTDGSGALSWGTVSTSDSRVTLDAQNNTCIGTDAGGSFSGTDANDNSLYGYKAGEDLTSGDKNVAIGRSALAAQSTGSESVAVGYKALEATNVGEQAAVGHEALVNQSGGDGRNVALGYKAGHSATTAKENIYIGYQAGKNTGGTDTGYRNIAIGYYAQGGGTTVTGNHNVGAGNGTWEDLTSGNGNTAFGSAAGSEVSTGDYNVLIGHQAGVNGSPAGKIDTEDGIVCLGDNNVTNFYCADTSISSSDERDKADITDFTAGLGWIKALRPVTYRWDKRDWYYTESDSPDTGKITRTPITKDGSKKKNKQHVGFVAQEVLAVEQANGFAANKDNMLTVHLNEDDTAYGMKYERLVPILVNAIKELSTEVDTLKTKVAALEAG